MTARADYLAQAKRVFAYYGFTRQPLTDAQLVRCMRAGVDPYGVGCDVAGGYAFETALFANQVEAGQ